MIYQADTRRGLGQHRSQWPIIISTPGERPLFIEDGGGGGRVRHAAQLDVTRHGNLLMLVNITRCDFTRMCQPETITS